MNAIWNRTKDLMCVVAVETPPHVHEEPSNEIVSAKVLKKETFKDHMEVGTYGYNVNKENQFAAEDKLYTAHDSGKQRILLVPLPSSLSIFSHYNVIIITQEAIRFLTPLRV
jgi:hypothetical protein